MKQLSSGLWLSVFLSISCLGPLHLSGQDEALSKCTKEELMTYFPEQVVKSVLLKANIPADKADSIAVDLAQKDRELTKIVEDKASKLDPNPFKDLSHRDLAIKIYRETLYEVFAKVLKSHGIKNEDQIQTLLEEINDAKSKLFIDCIRKQTAAFEESSAPATAPPPAL